MIQKTHFALGLGALAAIVGFAALVVVSLSGSFIKSYRVAATFERAGQLLEPGGDVKLRGVLVGRIQSIEVKPNGRARIELAMNPNQQVPNNVEASIRGKTLFGEKFIELRDTNLPITGSLKDGDEIPLSRTVPAFELESVLQTAVPILSAVEPGDLGGAFQALGDGFSGQEEAGKRTIDNSLTALKSINGQSDSLSKVLGGLDESSGAFANAAPDFIDSLDKLDQFNRSVISKSAEARNALKDAPTWLSSLGTIMSDKYDDLVDLSVLNVDVLNLVVKHRDALPSTVSALKRFTQDWDTNMSVGCFDQNGKSIGEVHPSLKDSTCWQIWNITGEPMRTSYGAGQRPTPDSTTSALAFKTQLGQMLKVQFGHQAKDLSVLVYSAVQDQYGLIPQRLL